MSRIGNLPIEIPEGVNVEISGQNVKVVGPKGNLSKELPAGLKVEINNDLVTISPTRKGKHVRALHGTYRSLIANMIKGVSEGYSKTLELVGTGYRAEMIDKKLSLLVGFSHPVLIDAPEGIEFKVEKTKIEILGIDKELVGLVASKIRATRPPEPYKGKGIKYDTEVVRRKPGKVAKAEGAAA